MSDYKVQVGKELYHSEGYLTPQRWSSYAITVREALLLKPKRVLEIGPGNGLVTDNLRKMGMEVKTLDHDAKLKPDHVLSFTDEAGLSRIGTFDLIIACEVFEHVRYEDFQKAARILRPLARAMIVSVPHTTLKGRFVYLAVKIPGLRRITLAKNWIYKTTDHEFNGQHYWEMGKRGFPIHKIANEFREADWRIEKQFFNPDNPYHYFFVLRGPN